jgi:hypothetical protein
MTYPVKDGNLSVAPKFFKENQTGSSFALTSGEWVDIPNCSITVTEAGTYCIQYVGRGSPDNSDYITFRLFDVTGSTSLSVTESIVDSVEMSVSGVTFETVTDTRAWKLQARASDIGATTIDNASGRTYIAAHRI